MHKQGMSYWWLPVGYSRTATAVLPTIHKEPRTSEQVFQLCHPAFISWNDVRTSGDKALVFVDGMPWMVGCAVRGLLHGGETSRVRVAERRRASRTPSCHFAVCLQCHAGRQSALQWTFRRHDLVIADASSRDVAASRPFNCCCEQQGRCGVTWFNCCCEQQRRCGVMTAAGCNRVGVVRLMALCWQLLFSVIARTWALIAGLEFGR